MTDSSPKRAARGLILAGLLFYLLMVLVFFLSIRHNNQGHFCYPLDDPYIHLALSEQLAHGHYGLNPGEIASPSSSILWPFLLAPFVGTAFFVYVPLLWNTLFGGIAVCVLATVVARLPGLEGERTTAKRILVLLLLIFCGNVILLTMLGMEHMLQVLISILCAAGLLRVWDGEPMPRWTIAAALLAPAVRYDSVGITLAVCIVLAGMRRWRAAIGIFLLAIAPLIVFAVFLHMHGLPGLPMSVMVKGNAFHHMQGSPSPPASTATAAMVKGSALHQGPLLRLLKVAQKNLTGLLGLAGFWPMIGVTLALLYAWRNQPDRIRRIILAVAVLVGVSHMVIGRFGWFYRYEVYAIVFLTLILVHTLGAPRGLAFCYLPLTIFYISSQYIAGTNSITTASRQVYEQQYQMHRFLESYYQGNGVAINDLGLTSFHRRSSLYVLDVYGLGSVEAGRATNKTADWLQGIVERHHAELAIIYPEWFHIPPSWTPLAEMCNADVPKYLSARCVVFYSTSSATNAVIHDEIVRFAPTLPQGVTLQIDPPRRNSGPESPIDTR